MINLPTNLGSVFEQTTYTKTVEMYIISAYVNYLLILFQAASIFKLPVIENRYRST